MMKFSFQIFLCAACLLFCACAAPVQTQEDLHAPPEAQSTHKHPATPIPGPKKTTQPEIPDHTEDLAQEAVVVREGDTLELHIIPQLVEAFSMTESEIKEVLAAAKSKLISSKTQGFSRMEGILVPGSYYTEGKTLNENVELWITHAEARYDALESKIAKQNRLLASERLVLASIIEWECIGAPFEKETSAVLQNRLGKNARLGCCSTLEYAAGYSRPYMTTADTRISSTYNTYKIRGLPPGPICVTGTAALEAAMSETSDTDLYYFFYDYARGTMQFFNEYRDFKEAANASKELFLKTFPDIGRHDKIDRRSVFGNY